ERGLYKIIDKVSVKLNQKKDVYEAQLSNPKLRKSPVYVRFIYQDNKLSNDNDYVECKIYSPINKV
nr:hypothetical protein [Escherichia coli]